MCTRKGGDEAGERIRMLVSVWVPAMGLGFDHQKKVLSEDEAFDLRPE